MDLLTLCEILEKHTSLSYGTDKPLQSNNKKENIYMHTHLLKFESQKFFESKRSSSLT